MNYIFTAVMLDTPLTRCLQGRLPKMACWIHSFGQTDGTWQSWVTFYHVFALFLLGEVGGAALELDPE